MIHQVSGGAEGQASDVERTVEYMFKLKKRLNRSSPSTPANPRNRWRQDSDRDYFMTADGSEGLRAGGRGGQSRKEAKLLDGDGVKSLTIVDRGREAALPQKSRNRNCSNRATMARASNLTMCCFCGKSHAEVRKLIAGPGVYICDNCINVCKSILDKELNEDARRQAADASACRSRRRFGGSSTSTCIGQDHAKKTLAVAVHNHYKRILQSQRRRRTRRPHSSRIRSPTSRSRRATSC